MSTRTCYLCHRPHGKGPRETRPYGPNGADLCAGCMFGEDGKKPDAAIQEEASRQFAKRIDDAAIEPGGVVVYDVDAQTMTGVRRGKA